MRVINNHTCKDCCFFDPDNKYCLVDDEYKTVSPKHPACHSFTSDDEDYEFNPTGNIDFDENNYGYTEDYD